MIRIYFNIQKIELLLAINYQRLESDTFNGPNWIGEIAPIFARLDLLIGQFEEFPQASEMLTRSYNAFKWGILAKLDTFFHANPAWRYNNRMEIVHAMNQTKSIALNWRNAIIAVASDHWQ